MGFYAEEFGYIPTFSKITAQSFYDSAYQPLYFLMCVTCKSIVPDIWFMHLCQTWIVCAVMFNFIRKRTTYIFSTALLFMLCMYPYFCFEILKESLAVSMLLIGYPYLEQKKYLKFFLFAGLALSFHFSGIIAFFIPFLQRCKFNKRFFWILIVVVFCGLKSEGWLERLTAYFLLGGTTAEKYNYYVHIAMDRFNINWFIDSFLRNVLVPVIVGIWMKWTYRKIQFEWAFCIYILLGLGTLEYAIIFERPLNYFLPFIVVSSGNLLGSGFQKVFYKKAITVLVCVAFWLGCRGLFYMRNEGWRLLIPYESVFEERIDIQREKVIDNIHQ